MGRPPDGCGRSEPVGCALRRTDLGVASRPPKMNVPFLSLRDRVRDPEFPAVQAQLTVFAREVGAFHPCERTRSRELDVALTEIQDTYLATMTSFARVVEAKARTTAGRLERTECVGRK